MLCLLRPSPRPEPLNVQACSGRLCTAGCASGCTSPFVMPWWAARAGKVTLVGSGCLTGWLLCGCQWALCHHRVSPATADHQPGQLHGGGDCMAAPFAASAQPCRPCAALLQAVHRLCPSPASGPADGRRKGGPKPGHQDCCRPDHRRHRHLSGLAHRPGQGVRVCVCGGGVRGVGDSGGGGKRGGGGATQPRSAWCRVTCPRGSEFPPHPATSPPCAAPSPPA